jgi:hypothetical protein
MPEGRLNDDKPKKAVTGIALSTGVLAELDAVAHKLDRSRSWVVEHLCFMGLKAGLHLKEKG